MVPIKGLDLKPINLMMKGGAIFSKPKATHRFVLYREWNATLPVWVFVMLNPSTADATKNDPTITRCIRTAQRNGAGGLFIGNLFAFRATQPDDMFKAEFPVGHGNDTYLVMMCSAAVKSDGRIVCAWGTGGTHQTRNSAFFALAHKHKWPLDHLRLTKQGHPEHPLYIPGDVVPKRLLY